MPRLPRKTLGRWWVCVDTETTGLLDDPLTEVVEVGAGLVNPDGTVVATYSTLVQHDGNSEAAAYCQEHVHGIRPRDARHGPGPMDADRVLGRVLSTWGGLVHREAPNQAHLRLHAWNRGFDQPMLERHGVLAERTSWRGSTTRWLWGECLQLWATPHLYAAGLPAPSNPDSRRHQRAPLQQAAEWLQVQPMGPAHRALADVYTTAAVVTALQVPGGTPGSPLWRPPVPRGAR